MRPPKFPWPSTVIGHGVLMFAQQMREMLQDQSFESFRAYSLDSIARLDEGRVVANDVQRDRIPQQALEPIQQELVWSLGHDPVAKDVANYEIGAIKNLLKRNDWGITDFSQHLILIRKRLSNYKQQSEVKILSLCDDPGKRIELRQATGFYCSHLLNLGYSKSFLLRNVEEYFFDKQLNRIGKRTLGGFFRLFDNKNKKFVVCSMVDENFGKFLAGLGYKIYAAANDLPNNLGPDVSQKLPLLQKQSYALRYISAFDEDTAVADSARHFSYGRALAFVIPHNLNFHWHREMYVKRARAASGRVLAGDEMPLQRTVIKNRTTKRLIRETNSYTNQIVTSFSDASSMRILSSLNTCALARTSTSIENQLVSLWSAIEVLVSEPPKGRARITHYVKLAVPCICVRYLRRQFVAVFNEMLVAYRKKFMAIVNSAPDFPDRDQHTKFAAILCLSHNNNLRNDLMALTGNNPLARHRLWKLHKECETPKAIKATLEGHEQRVGWQMQRIYRARNNLVHAGVRPSYIDSLVLNLDEYYRSFLGTMVNRAGKSGVEAEIDQTIAEIGIEYAISLSYLDTNKNDTSLSEEAFLRFLT